MATDNDQSDRGWVEHWARVGPELERIRRVELRRCRHEDVFAALGSLCEIKGDTGAMTWLESMKSQT